MYRRLLCVSIFIASINVFCAGQQTTPPGCQAITYFGVSGCLPATDGSCPAGYHLQAVGPTNPAMKAPTRQFCVADSKTTQVASPESTTEAFYKWYIRALQQNREPLTQDESELRKYVTAALIEKIKKQMDSPDGLEADYFIQAQDYLDDWETNISVSKAVVRGAEATTTVTLGATEKSRHRLGVILIHEAGEWKISRVRRLAGTGRSKAGSRE